MALDDRYHDDWAHMSRYIRELFNHHCAKCEANCKSPISQEKSLQVHHIDENPGNNEMENLIPLCASCHLQIEHEARVHAPSSEVQIEFFEENTYMSAMKEMRLKALEKFGGEVESATKKMSQEDYELSEMDFQMDDFDY